MRKLLRAVMWADLTEKDAASSNLRGLVSDRFLSVDGPAGEVMEYCLQFLIQSNEAPSIRLVYDHFEKIPKPEVITRMEEILSESFYASASFKAEVEGEVERQAAEALAAACKEAITIATVGVKSKTGTVKGVDAAVANLFSTVRDTPKDNQDKIPTSQKDATKALKDLYLERKNNPAKTYGVMTGYGLIDSSTGGIRKKQLYLHAGYGGHLKSTMMLNMIVNAAEAGWNPLLFSSEMPQEALMFLLTAIHSANPKFVTIHPPIPAFSLLLGQLTAPEEAFYDLVQDDLTNNPDHGCIRVIDSGEFTTFGSVMQRTLREHFSTEVDVLWVDYITRLPVDLKYRSMSPTEARNEILADAKRFAMSFGDGEGLAVCSPFQVNREGYRKAKEHEGRMDMTALASFNAAEKEADVISYIFYDEEERILGEPKVGILKSRWGSVANKPVSLYLEPDSRRICDLSSGMSVTSSSGMSVTDASSEVEI